MIAANTEVSVEMAEYVSTIFTEVIVAPAYEPGAVEVLTRKKKHPGTRGLRATRRRPRVAADQRGTADPATRPTRRTRRQPGQLDAGHRRTRRPGHPHRPGVRLAGLPRGQVQRLAEAWIAAAPAGFRIIVHAGTNALPDARAIVRHAQARGAAAVALSPPTYHRPADVAALAGYIAELAAEVPGLPVYYYHIPVMTGVRVAMIDLLEALDGRVANFAGIKYTDENLMDFSLCLRFRAGRRHAVRARRAAGVRPAAGRRRLSWAAPSTSRRRSTARSSSASRPATWRAPPRPRTNPTA